MKRITFTILMLFTALVAIAMNGNKSAINHNSKAHRVGENIDVTHYEVRINNFDFVNQAIDAVTTVTLTALADVSEIDLELKGLTVTSVVSDDATVGSFSQDDDILKITLDANMTQNQSALFTISYNGHATHYGFGGVYWDGNYVFNMGRNQDKCAGKNWFPCIDDFVDKASYDLYVTIPSDLTSSCGGILVDSNDNNNGTKTDHWVVTQDIPAHLISFAVGEYLLWEDTFHGIERDIPINVYARLEEFDNVPGTFVNIKEIAAYFESCFGPYPLNRIGFVSTATGNMEHVDNIGLLSSLISGDTDFEHYYVHEMAHAWFGDMVTCASVNEIWLNEGFANFACLAYMIPLYGEDVYQANIDWTIEHINQNGDNTVGWIPLNDIPANYSDDHQFEYKEEIVVHTLRNYLGVELFNEAIQYYLNKFAWQSATSEDLRDAITEYTGIDMTGFFDSWVFTCGAPHYSVECFNVTPNGNKFDVEVFTRQSHRNSDHMGTGVILELAFLDSNWNIVTDTIHWDGETGYTMKTIDFEPIAVFCDYYNKYADARTDRNYVVKQVGNLKFDKVNFDINVSSISDSTLLHVEHHWVGPDHSQNMDLDWLRYSNKRYFSVFRNDKGEADISGVFTYSKSSYEEDLIQSESDSIVLLYRENASQPWRSISYTIQGNWKLGKITVAELLPGDYTLATVDLTIWDGIGENVNKNLDFAISPNPATDFVDIILVETRHALSEFNISITDLTGKVVDSFPFSGEKMRVSVSDYPSGVYFFNLLDGNNKIATTKKIIVK